jgi:hypothetical protein
VAWKESLAILEFRLCQCVFTKLRRDEEGEAQAADVAIPLDAGLLLVLVLVLAIVRTGVWSSNTNSASMTL